LTEKGGSFDFQLRYTVIRRYANTIGGWGMEGDGRKRGKGWTLIEKGDEGQFGLKGGNMKGIQGGHLSIRE